MNEENNERYNGSVSAVQWLCTVGRRVLSSRWLTVQIKLSWSFVFLPRAVTWRPVRRRRPGPSSRLRLEPSQRRRETSVGLTPRLKTTESITRRAVINIYIPRIHRTPPTSWSLTHKSWFQEHIKICTTRLWAAHILHRLMPQYDTRFRLNVTSRWASLPPVIKLKRVKNL